MCVLNKRNSLKLHKCTSQRIINTIPKPQGINEPWT